MPRKSPVKIIHDTFEYNAADLARLYPDWRYAAEFSKACERDGGKATETVSAAAGHVYCEKDGVPYWEYMEGYTDIRPLYTGPPLNRDFTVFFRAIALAPPVTNGTEEQ
jgi:hypothetical protein